MKLHEILTEDCTLCAVPATSKKKILETISEKAAEHISGSTTFELLDSLITREKMGSTGIGNGIAIPHGRLPNTEKVIAVLVTTSEPVSFDSIDNRPVDIFIALFVPEEQCQQHLCTLQSIAQVFSDKRICKQARKCETSHELYSLVQQTNH
ncbi:PTS IIA-like nitrogen regulatory protein PtsN [Thalassotalea fusca]